MRIAAHILTILGVLAIALPAWAQTSPPVTAEPATMPAADKDLSLDNTLKGLDENMSRQDMEAMVKKANENRLKSERKLVAAEIGGGFYDPDAVDKADAVLEKDAKNTQQDNIDHICRAFACVDAKFAELYKLYNEKNYKQAALKGKVLVNTQSTYLGAAKSYVYSVALEADGGDYNVAADAYTDLVTDMLDRISFASESVRRLADLYDRNGRGIYAMQTYAYLLKNYGLTMDEKSFNDIYAKVKKLQEMYGDPMGTVAKMMSDVKERLAGVDSGKDTQARQQSIVAMLDDLIKTEEDKSSPGGKPPPSSQNKKSDGKKPGEGDGESKQPSQLPNSKPVKKSGSHAPKSILRPGEDPKHGENVSQTNTGKEKGDWSTLPPDEKVRLEEMSRLLINERYRDVIIDYHKSLATSDK